MSFGRASALLPFRRPRSHAILTAATLPLSSARHSPLRRPVLVCQHSRSPPTPAHCTALTSRRHMPRHLSCVTHLTHAALSWPQHAHSTPCSSPCDAICCYRADTAAHSSSSLNAAPVLRHTNQSLSSAIYRHPSSVSPPEACKEKYILTGAAALQVKPSPPLPLPSPPPLAAAAARRRRRPCIPFPPNLF